MIEWLFIPTALLYFLISMALFIFGVNFIYLSILTWIHDRHPEETPEPIAEWPSVTVQLPIYNELYVAERVIRTAARLDYPRELLEIQVLDDSTDDTTAIAKETVEQLRARGLNIVLLHRRVRSNYKAGALQAGLERANGEFIAIFDADFVPSPDFLKQTLPHILAAPKAAFVQTRWGHLNQTYSWLTHLQSLAIDAHFAVEQFARSRGGYWFNFNGTAGIWRREALQDAGGWQGDTLTEDLDLSYRAYLRGWMGAYVRDIEVKAEVPVSFNAFRRQQHRWARGSLECAGKLIPQVWQAPTTLVRKVQATLHLTSYSVHLLLFLLALLYPLVALFSPGHPRFTHLYGFAYLFSLAALAPTIFFITGQQQLKRPWRRFLPKIVLVSVVGSGLMINTVRAAWQIVSQPNGIFERTAKFGLRNGKQKWTHKRYQSRFDPIVYVELLMGVYCLSTTWLAWQLKTWGIAFYGAFFGTGLILASAVTIAQELAIFANRLTRAQHTTQEQEQMRSQLLSKNSL